MNPQREFLIETFHDLAQPISILRTTMELGLLNTTDDPNSQRVLEDCLCLLDRVTREFAIYREIVSLDKASLLHPVDARELLMTSVEEMTLVAEDSGVSLRAFADPVLIECDKPMLKRAIFLLLDSLIASTARGGEASIALRKTGDGVLLESTAKGMEGPREKLCAQLLQCAGGKLHSLSSPLSAVFPESAHRQVLATSLTDKQFLTAH